MAASRGKAVYMPFKDRTSGGKPFLSGLGKIQRQWYPTLRPPLGRHSFRATGPRAEWALLPQKLKMTPVSSPAAISARTGIGQLAPNLECPPGISLGRGPRPVDAQRVAQLMDARGAYQSGAPPHHRVYGNRRAGVMRLMNAQRLMNAHTAADVAWPRDLQIIARPCPFASAPPVIKGRRQWPNSIAGKSGCALKPTLESPWPS